MKNPDQHEDIDEGFVLALGEGVEEEGEEHAAHQAVLDDADPGTQGTNQYKKPGLNQFFL